LKAYGDKTKRDYIDAIIEVIKELELKYTHMTVRFLISVNRE